MDLDIFSTTFLKRCIFWQWWQSSNLFRGARRQFIMMAELQSLLWSTACFRNLDPATIQFTSAPRHSILNESVKSRLSPIAMSADLEWLLIRVSWLPLILYSLSPDWRLLHRNTILTLSTGFPEAPSCLGSQCVIPIMISQPKIELNKVAHRVISRTSIRINTPASPTQRWSYGLLNSGPSLINGIQTINISDESGVVKIVTRKTKASPRAVASAYTTSSIRAKSGSRRSLGVTAQLAKRGYRPDLRKVNFPLFFCIPCGGRASEDTRRILVRTHRIHHWKAGRGHVCKIK